jgi:valyl-tRNA synthetase
MPFITEEIWQHLVDGETIMIEPWPAYDSSLEDLSAEEDMDVIMNVIRSIRNIRSEMGVELGKKIKVICCADTDRIGLLKTNALYIHDLADVGELQLYEVLKETPEKAVTSITDNVQIYVPIAGMIDMDKEIARLTKEIERLDAELERVVSKLSNEEFLKKAPEAIVEKERCKKDELVYKKEQVQARLAMLTA